MSYEESPLFNAKKREKERERPLIFLVCDNYERVLASLLFLTNRQRQPIVFHPGPKSPWQSESKDSSHHICVFTSIIQSFNVYRRDSALFISLLWALKFPPVGIPILFIGDKKLG